MSPDITISPDNNTSLSLVVENSFDCRDTAVIDIFVQQEPNYTPLSDTTIIIGEELMINLNAGNGFIYSWSPQEWLSCADCPNPIIQPLRSTTYLINISDSLGCFNITDTLRVEVIEEFSLEVPQAFSPNGDGVNDVIYAEGWGLKELISFKIYNRFGELVFEGNEFDQGWDGTYKGKDQMIETYVYTVEAETYSGEILSRKGNITLIR
jgi:gliding motility-associated-like protein